MLKILLDIDGVMVITPTWRQPDFLADGFMAFDSQCANRLATLVTQTQADIVLTSTHRIHYDEKTWQTLLANRGIITHNVSKVNQVTRFVDFKSRDIEITDWVNHHPTEKFIIIDDDKSLRNLPDSIKDVWVETQFLTGFNDTAFNTAQQIINRLCP